MSRRTRYDAVVVGAGPNGLAAAITLAQAGRTVVVYEASETVGGGSRTQELTLPGFRHDVCSAIHPLGVASPFFRTLPLARYGLEWVYPPAALAHPLDDGAAILERSMGLMGATLGKQDAEAWRNLFTPFVEHWDALAQGILGPLRPRFQLAHPLISLQMARFGLSAFQPARGLAERTFHGRSARALFGGMAAHAMLPLEKPASAAIALVLGTLGHLIGWPFPKGGSQAFVDALAAYLRSLGGEVVTDAEVSRCASYRPHALCSST
jgi:phytoene dehydrogenase-like protein